ncbi:MAG TPA: hypothetical protein PLH80_01830 [Spirochaetota bacterium]|nr:hypothetical protein [Spirochaetota bacterium]HOT20656.1 hypothetical protein [Spirochaetota bacterium]HPD05664.1 hypothetical protein [Spirochaetota bacterium]HQG41680.1 hypothetical protein [Spirochaetota bacterium]HQI37289.1 hypothetical protein [Spirochaetota bacterium]
MFRGHYCRVLVRCLFIIVLVIVSCGKTPPLQFCEGVTDEGTPVNCGSQFTTGDMTLYVTAKEAFGSTTATVVIYEKKHYSQPEYTRFDYTINPDVSSTIIPLSLYAEGTYIVTVIVGDKEIASGTISIVDTY